jgi:hypothetical protein
MESPWEGGGGYTPEEIGRMSLDQIWSRLCKMEVLKRDVGSRVEKVESQEAVGLLKSDAEGKMKGRARDGTAIRGVIRGKSKARELMEQQAKTKRKRRR